MRKYSQQCNVRLRLALVVLALAGRLHGGTINEPRPTPPPNPHTTAGVSADGRIIPEGGVVRLTAPTGPGGAGVVSQIFVQVGEEITEPGKLLAVLNNRDLLEAQLTAAERDAIEAKAAHTQIEAGGAQAIARIETQIAEVEGRELTLDAAMRRAGAETSLALDQAKREESAAKAALEAFRRLEPVIKAAAAANVAAAQAQLDMIPTNRNERKVAAAQLEAAKVAEQRALLDYSAQLDDLTAKADLTGLRARLAEAALVRLPPPEDPTKLAPVQADLLAARNLLAAQRRLLESTRKENTAAAAFAQARLDAAEAAVVTARAELPNAEVRAPGRGRILRINARPGEVVGPAGVFDFGDTREMYVEAEVDVNAISRVKVGHPATILIRQRPDADLRLSGTVVEISPVVAPNSLTSLNPVARMDTRIVPVKVKLDKPELVQNLVNLQVVVVINP